MATIFERRRRYRQGRLGASLGVGIVVGTVFLAPLTPVAAVHAQTSKAAGRPGGDIPDSAAYLRFTGRSLSVEYVEGWVQTTTTRGVTFSDKDSSVVVEMYPPVPSLSSFVQGTGLRRLRRMRGFRQGALTHDRIAGRSTVHLSCRTLSAPDAVTGKTVVLQSDRYYIDGSHGLAILILSTPLGVDNADAFRRIAHSFRFR